MAGPIMLHQGKPMKKHALEIGAQLLVADVEKVAGEASAPKNVKWVPQPVNFSKLKTYRNPYHTRAIRIKARMTAGLGFKEEVSLPTSAQNDPFSNQLLLCAMDLEHTGNAYFEVITAAGGKIAAITWVPAETMEISADHLYYRHTSLDPSTKRKSVSFYESFPEKPQPGKRYILHTTLDGTWSTYYGEPDWLGALDSVMLFDSAMKYNRATFDNNCIPTWLIFLLGVKLSDERIEDPNNAGHYLPSQREEFINWMKQTYGGADNMGGAMLIDLPGMGSEIYSEKASIQFQKLQDGPKDADFLRLIERCRDDILSAHGVPPRLAGVVTSGQLGGSGEMFGQLLAFREDIKPKQEIWEHSLAQLIPYFEGVNSLTLNEMDIEQFRDQPLIPELPATATDADVARQAEAILRAVK